MGEGAPRFRIANNATPTVSSISARVPAAPIPASRRFTPFDRLEFTVLGAASPVVISAGTDVGRPTFGPVATELRWMTA